MAIWEVETTKGVIVGGVNADSADEAIQRISAFSRISPKYLRAFTADDRLHEQVAGAVNRDCRSYSCAGIGTPGGCVSICAAESRSQSLQSKARFLLEDLGRAPDPEPPVHAETVPGTDFHNGQPGHAVAPRGGTADGIPTNAWGFAIDEIDAIPFDIIRGHLRQQDIVALVQRYIEAGGRDLPGVRIFPRQ